MTPYKDKFWEDWRPPAALRRSAPREVRMTASGIGMMILAVCMVAGGIAGGVAFRASAQRTAHEVKLLEEQGRVAEGVVVRLRRSGGRNETESVEYRFTADSREYTHDHPVSHGFWRTLRAGAPIAIRYLPSNPRRSFPDAAPPRPAPPWTSFAFGGMFVVIAGPIVLMILRSRRLLEDGRAAPGIVTGNQRRSNGETTHNVVTYDLRLSNGSIVKGRANRRRIPEGTIICVVYDPDNPKRNAPYPFQLMKVAEE